MGAQAVLILMVWHELEDAFKAGCLQRLILLPVLFLAVSFLPNVDLLGHLGGIIGGAAVGIVIFIGKAELRHRKWFLACGIGALAIVLVVPLCVIYLTGSCPVEQ
jgi:hypothetical protein